MHRERQPPATSPNDFLAEGRGIVGATCPFASAVILCEELALPAPSKRYKERSN